MIDILIKLNFLGIALIKIKSNQLWIFMINLINMINFCSH
jgi:hypothetical protein